MNIVPVVGYEGLYSVDETGNVYSEINSSSRRKGMLKQYSNENGYMKVNLYDCDGSCKKKYVHRIVAEAFIPNTNNYPCVNHIDCNVKNNSVSNLEWCNQSQNVKHQVECGRHSKAIPTIVNGIMFKSEKKASYFLYNNGWEYSYRRRKGMMQDVMR